MTGTLPGIEEPPALAPAEVADVLVLTVDCDECQASIVVRLLSSRGHFRGLKLIELEVQEAVIRLMDTYRRTRASGGVRADARPPSEGRESANPVKLSGG